MTDYLALAAKLMAEFEESPNKLQPYSQLKLRMAEVYSRMAEAQAHRCVQCPIAEQLADVVDLKPKPRQPRHIQTTGDRL